MSLLDCLCCPKHSYRTAAISDDLRISFAETFGNLLQRACLVACCVRKQFQKFSTHSDNNEQEQDRVVALWAETCPEAVSGILGILSVPAVYLPMSLKQAPLISGEAAVSGWAARVGGAEERLKQCGVKVALIHHSCFEYFTSEDWSSTHVDMETSLVEHGFICATFDWAHPLPSSSSTSSSSSSSSSSPLSPLPLPSSSFLHTDHCTAREKCKSCKLISTRDSTDTQHTHRTALCLSGDLLRDYLSDVREATQCLVCTKHVMDHAINSNSGQQLDAENTSDHRSINSNISESDVVECAINSNSKWNLPDLPPTSLAYVLHTSGTTGRPKPVRVPHCCIVPNIADLSHRFSMCPDDCVFNAAPLTFDPSIVEMFLALSNGASLLLVPDRVKRSPHDLANSLFHRHHTTVLQITPSLFYRLPESEIADRLLGDRSRVRTLAFGGERFPSLRMLAEYKTTSNKTRIFNIYGTTEVSSWSTCYAVTDMDLQTARNHGRREEEGEGEGEMEREGEGEGEMEREGEGEGEREEEREGGKEGERGGEREGVPLGEVLLGTTLEVRDVSPASGERVHHGYGEIWLGGEYRVCLLDDEASPTPSTMRGTGDRGRVCGGGKTYFAGRLDRQIKRWGHRISLELVEECIQAHPSLSTCAVATVSSYSTPPNFPRSAWRPLPSTKTGRSSELSDTDHLLVAFVVPVPCQPRPPHVPTPHQPSEWAGQLMSSLVQSLPGYCVPDMIVPVQYLPCNQHGKVDMNRLLRFDADPALYLPPAPLPATVTATPHVPAPPAKHIGASSGEGLSDTRHRQSTIVEELQFSLPTTSEIESELLLIVTRFTRFSNWPAELTLLELGATSFDVVRIANAMETMLSGCGQLPALTEALLSKNLRGVVSFVWAELGGGESRAGEMGDSGGGCEWAESCKRKQGGRDVMAPPPKRERSSALTSSLVWRRGQMFSSGTLLPIPVHTQPPTTASIAQHSSIKMAIKWSYRTGRCVDASPLVVCRGQAPPTLYIGSHSGEFVSLCVQSGKLRWNAQLRDRIESSACLSLCGAYVVIGCYDGCVYCLRTDGGSIHWSLQLSPEPVKSSACVDPASGAIWVGSHDQHLYSIDVEAGCVVHKVFLGGGSCFSSPCIDPDRGLVYAATLQGTVVAVDKDEGVIFWAFSCGKKKPVFSSPSLLPSGEVVVGCVDGGVYIIDPRGREVGRLDTEEPIFSSCSVALISGQQLSNVDQHQPQPQFQIDCPTSSIQPENTSGEIEEAIVQAMVVEEADVLKEESTVRVLCGSHDKSVYCWSGWKGELLWRTSVDTEVYSTPVVCTLLRNSTLRKEPEARAPISSHQVSEAKTSSPGSSDSTNATSTLNTRRHTAPNNVDPLLSPFLSCVCVCSTSGLVHLLDLWTGGLCSSVGLPGEVFSSPAIVENHIVVGCRDDCVYCIECFSE